jgi:hypothetical protein
MLKFALLLLRMLKHALLLRKLKHAPPLLRVLKVGARPRGLSQ